MGVNCWDRTDKRKNNDYKLDSNLGQINNHDFSQKEIKNSFDNPIKSSSKRSTNNHKGSKEEKEKKKKRQKKQKRKKLQIKLKKQKI